MKINSLVKMEINSLVKPLVVAVVAWLTTPVVNATDDIKEKTCKSLELEIWEKDCKEEKTCENTEIDIKEWVWKIKIEKKTYTIKLWKNWVAIISEESDGHWADIFWEMSYENDWKWKCKL